MAITTPRSLARPPYSSGNITPAAPFPQLWHYFNRKGATPHPTPSHVERFALGKFPDTLAKLLLFLSKTEFHVFSGAAMCSCYTQPKYNLYHSTLSP